MAFIDETEHAQVVNVYASSRYFIFRDLKVRFGPPQFMQLKGFLAHNELPKTGGSL